MARKICTFNDCSDYVHGHGYCSKHYRLLVASDYVYPPGYNTWVSMKSRCYNTSHGRYKDYGGRGIKVCERWIESFQNFIDDMGNKPGKDYSLDRIDNNGNYEPSNCRWATREQQQANTRQIKYGYPGIIKLDTLSGITWMVRKKINGSSKHLGKFKSLEEAINFKKNYDRINNKLPN